jgi:hypothetical protein
MRRVVPEMIIGKVVGTYDLRSDALSREMMRCK